MTVLPVLVFGPESVSYERSRRENRAKFHEISARVFFVRISKSQDSSIYIQYQGFSGYIFPKWILSLCFSVTRPGRPAARHGSQVIKLVRFPVFPGSQVIKMGRVPVFPGSQAIKMVRFPIFPGSQASNPTQNQIKK